MRLKEVIKESKKIHSLVKIKFRTVTLEGGLKVMSFNDDKGNKYVIGASIENPFRFHKWDGKQAMADILPTKRRTKLKDGRKVIVARLRTTVRVEGDEKSDKKGDFVI